MRAKSNEQQLSLLVKALLSLENEEEAKNLLADLCTIREVQDLGQRIEVARLLRSAMTYNDIAEATGASTATISRVNRCLLYGSGGYRTVLERLEESEKDHD
ncbi:MAG: TrpR-like protein YerC/YecD [Clostridia bacterium]|nr:TrpR-like protein YerC/YecD [Clostridia bacterium]MBO4884995.1 TrpR-like protein YerC/YecD [Clostridia bacterium]MBR4443461.1 TrpR-like protein YerC/YecD [Clostridia bacterium]